MAKAISKTSVKKNKYNYFKVIQQAYGQGWEDVSQYPCNSQGIVTEMSGKFKELRNGRKRELTVLEYDLAEYKYKNQYPTRVIFRKEKNK
jgi:hypothetical protein